MRTLSKDDFGQNIFISVRCYKYGCFKVVEFDGKGLREGLAARIDSKTRYFKDGGFADNKEAAVRHALKREQHYQSRERVVKRGGIPYWTEEQCIHVRRGDAAETPVCGQCEVKPFAEITENAQGENSAS